jgi:hypothetical protein
MFLGSKVQPVCRVDNLRVDCLDSVGSLTSQNPIGLHGLLRGWLQFVAVHVPVGNPNTFA